MEASEFVLDRIRLKWFIQVSQWRLGGHLVALLDHGRLLFFNNLKKHSISQVINVHTFDLSTWEVDFSEFKISLFF